MARKRDGNEKEGERREQRPCQVRSTRTTDRDNIAGWTRTTVTGNGKTTGSGVVGLGGKRVGERLGRTSAWRRGASWRCGRLGGGRSSGLLLGCLFVSISM